MAITVNHQTNDISATSGSLTIDGAAVGGGGSLEYISTATISSSTATVNISLPIGYDRFEIIFDLYSSAKAHLYMAFSEDSGSTFLVTDFTTSSQDNQYDGSLNWPNAAYSGAVATDRAEYLVGAIRLFNASASSGTIFRGECNGFVGAGIAKGAIMNSTGLSTSQTSRINTVQMRSTAGFVWNSGKFVLYGIKEA